MRRGEEGRGGGEGRREGKRGGEEGKRGGEERGEEGKGGERGGERVKEERNIIMKSPTNFTTTSIHAISSRLISHLSFSFILSLNISIPVPTQASAMSDKVFITQSVSQQARQ